MSARDVLSVMIRTDRGSMTVWSPQEAQGAIDAYRAEVLQRESAEIVAHCPEHADGDTCWPECHCPVAEDMLRRTEGEQQPVAPTPLRWGQGDAELGDDDSVTLWLSGPAGEPYVLELDADRARALWKVADWSA